MTKKCPWCERNQGRCDTDELVKGCDFRTLKYEKAAIMQRVKEEWGNIQDARKGLVQEQDREKAEKMALDAADRIEGMKIMMIALQEDFGMSNPASILGMGGVNIVDAAKVAMRLKVMEKMRGRT